jgi:uncharacterized protein YlaI
MDILAARKPPRRVSVRCTHCGDWDTINDRSLRRKTAEGKPHFCSICRAVQSIRVDDDDRDYWTTRFSQQEIDAMVGAII